MSISPEGYIEANSLFNLCSPLVAVLFINAGVSMAVDPAQRPLAKCGARVWVLPMEDKHGLALLARAQQRSRIHISSGRIVRGSHSPFTGMILLDRCFGQHDDAMLNPAIKTRGKFVCTLMLGYNLILQ